MNAARSSNGHAPEAVRDSRGRPTLLFVDDEPDLLDMLRDMLEGEGFRVLCTQASEEALRLVEEARPDLVFLDVSMPTVDGLEVLRRLRELPVARDLPVLMLTSLSGSREIAASSALGARGYLVKPVTRRQLLHKIRAVLGERPSEESPSAAPPDGATQDPPPGSALAEAIASALEPMERALGRAVAGTLGHDLSGERAARLHAVSRKLDILAAAQQDLREHLEFLRAPRQPTAPAPLPGELRLALQELVGVLEAAPRPLVERLGSASDAGTAEGERSRILGTLELVRIAGEQLREEIEADRAGGVEPTAPATAAGATTEDDASRLDDRIGSALNG